MRRKLFWMNGQSVILITIHKNGLPKNQKELKENTQNYMENLQKNTQKIANFFQHQSVKYAS